MADLGVPTPNYSGNAGVDWSWLGNLPDQFYRGSQQRQQYNLSHAFDKGVPTNPDGSPNYAALLQIYGRNGDTADIPTLGGLAQQQQQLKQAQTLDPMLAGIGQGGAPSAGGPAASLPSPIPPAPGGMPDSAPPASAAGTLSTARPEGSSPAAAPATGETIGVLVGTALRGNDKAPVVAANIAKAVGVDPGTPLTPDQLARAQKYIGSYVQRNGLGELPGAGLMAGGLRPYLARVAQIESGGNPNATNGNAKGEFQLEPGTARQYGVTDPTNTAQATAATVKLTLDNVQTMTKALGRQPTPGELYLAHQQGATGALKLLTDPDAKAVDVVGRQAVIGNGGTPDMSAGQFAQMWEAKFNGTPPSAAAQPIIPQVPLPKGFTDPQQAILAMDAEMARLSTNPQAQGQITALKDWRDRIAGATKPMEIGPSTTYVDPRTGQILYQGPYARGLQGESGATLDADAERYLASGTLPPNMGRGMQGAAQATAIRERAEELAQDRGIDPATMPERWQQYKAHQGGIQYFTYGQGGRTIKSFDVLTDHLGTLSDAVGALKNGNMRLFNQVGQEVARQTGSEAPTDFDAIKSIVGDEVVKAVVGSGGALGDREEVKRALDRANSPQQLAGVIDSYRRLALGQLRGLQKQYQEATGLDDFDQHLSPGTLNFFRSSSARSSAAGVPKVASDADYDALPSGSIFIDPDGKKRRKP